MQTETLRML